MKRMLLPCAAMMILGAPSLQAQPDSSLDTVSIVVSTTRVFDGQLVDYFLLDIGDARLAFIEDSAYVKLIGLEEAGDTTLLPEPKVWMRTNNPMIGDFWDGMIPNDLQTSTVESIDDTIQVSVPAGVIPVFKVHVYDQYATFLGQKWWADGVGLVGWDLQICNEQSRLELVDYDVTPGDFWPHEVGDFWVLRSIDDRTTIDAPQVTVTVDGESDDWLGTPHLFMDPADDTIFAESGTDLADLWAGADETHLYIMVTFWDGEPDTVWAAGSDYAYVFLFDEQGTGNFYGFAVTYEPFPVSEWRATGIQLSDAGVSVAAGQVLELSVPLAGLGSFAYHHQNFQVLVDSGRGDLTCAYDVRFPVCPIVMAGDVNNDQAIGPSDIIHLVNNVLKAGPPPYPCLAAGDVNCTGNVATSDIIYLVNVVFKAGPAPCDICATIGGMWSCP